MIRDSSIRHLQTAADAGDPESLYELGNCYAYGLGAPINIRRALELWMAAALQGHANAVYRIGLCYSLGTCVPRNIETAVQMWRKAAASGCADAMHMLGVCHLNGDGVPKSVPHAIMWLLLASTYSHAEADAVLHEITPSLSDADRDKGIRLMSDWLKHPIDRA